MKFTWKYSAIFAATCSALLLAAPAIAREDAVPFSVKVSGKGRPMILIPGLTCGGGVWDGTVAHFQDKFECHVLTLAGFAGQPAIGEPFLDRERAAIVKYIADKKLDHPVIIGHSLGGMLSYWIAATAPDAVGPIIAVDGLPYLSVLMNPAATPESMKDSAAKFRAFYDEQKHEVFVAGTKTFLTAMITSPEDVKFVAAESEKSDPKAIGQAFYEMMTTDLRPQLKAIKVPVLLLGSTSMAPTAEQKPAVEAAYRAQLTNAPRHTVVFVPDARHFIQLDQPKIFYAEVEKFLKEAGAAPKK